MELASDLMCVSSMSRFSVPLRVVGDWKSSSLALIAALESGTFIGVQRVGDTFIVLERTFVDNGGNSAVVGLPVSGMRYWLLFTVQEQRVDVRFHHPPGSYALRNKSAIIQTFSHGLEAAVKHVNTYHLLQMLNEDKHASPALIPPPPTPTAGDARGQCRCRVFVC